MCGELHINWREPDAVWQVCKSSLIAAMGRSSTRLVVGVIVIAASFGALAAGLARLGVFPDVGNTG